MHATQRAKYEAVDVDGTPYVGALLADGQILVRASISRRIASKAHCSTHVQVNRETPRDPSGVQANAALPTGDYRPSPLLFRGPGESCCSMHLKSCIVFVPMQKRTRWIV
jgi:hypothetical protein